MGNKETNFQALVEAIGATLERFGVQPAPCPGVERPTSIERVWLPQSLPVLHPTSLSCYGELPRDPAFAIRVQTGRAFTLTLDREWTTPQAILGIKFGSRPSSRTDCAILIPGQTITVPNGFYEFWVFAADGLDLVPGVMPLDTRNERFIVGYVSFLIGRTLDAKPDTREPHPRARVLAFGSLLPALGGLPFLASPNVKAVRVRMHPFTEDPLGITAQRFAVNTRIRSYDRERYLPTGMPEMLLEEPDNYGRGTVPPNFATLPHSRYQVGSSSAFPVIAGVPVNNVAEVVFAPMAGSLNFIDYCDMQLLHISGDPVALPIDSLYGIISAVDSVDGANTNEALVCDITTAPNTALDTGPVPLGHGASYVASWLFSGPLGGAITSTVSHVDEDGNYFLYGNVTHAVASIIGQSVGYTLRALRFATPAAGVGISTRLRVFVGKSLSAR